MEKQFSYYDVLGHLVPGTLLFLCVHFALSRLGLKAPVPTMAAPVEAIAFLGVVMFLGQLVQALGSLLEPRYFKLMGGRPSDEVMSGRDRRLSGEPLKLARRALQDDLGAETMSDDQLFVHAMGIANKHGLGRVERFNALYAYHRGLLTVAVVACLEVPLIWLVEPLVLGHQIAHVKFGVLLMSCLLLLWVLFLRTKQRGHYYAREVVQMAHRFLVDPRNDGNIATAEEDA